MSEVEASRDPDTGQFTPSTEGLFGREYDNAVAGFTTKKDDPPADEKIYESSDSASLREAAADLAAKRGEAEQEPITVKDVLELDPKEAVTVEQAAREHSTARADIATFYDGMDLAKFADEIDAKRAEVIKGDPKVAEALGVEVPAKDDAKSKGEAASDQNDAATVDAIDTMEGLDQETKKAFKIPQVRQALEQKFAEIDTAREQYATGLQTGQQMLQATVSALAPQLDGMPVEYWPQAIQQLAQVDPVRANLVADTLTKWGAIQQAQQQEQQRQAHERRQQFEVWRQQYSKASDEVLGPMTTAEKLDMAEELVAYVGEHGISREAFLHEAQTNLALHHPAFQKMAADALNYRRMQKASKAISAKPLPPVQRPGVAAARVSSETVSIAALEKQFNALNGRGDKAIRIMGQINAAKRAARNR